MTITISAYTGNSSFDQLFLGLRQASGQLALLNPNQMVYGQWGVVGGSVVYTTPQTVFWGSGFSNGSTGIINSIVLGAPGVPFQSPGTAPYFSIAGLNVATATFNLDPLAALRSDAVHFNGSTSRDIFTGSAFGDALYGGLGDDDLYGGLGQDTLYGGQNNDHLYGGRAADALYGGLGQDTLAGGLGADYLDGGDGFDYADYSGADAGIVLDMQNSTLNTGHAQGDTLVSIEGVMGSAFGDSIYGTAGDDLLISGAGDDFVYGREGRDDLFGGAGNDTLRGGVGPDNLSPGTGNDTIYGGPGADQFFFYGTEDGVSTGADTIMDFELAFDKMQLIGLGVSETNFHLAVFQVGADTVIHAVSGATLTLLNIDRDTFLAFANYELF